MNASSAVTMQFPVTRSGDLAYEAVLNYHTVDGTAHAGTDYTAAAGMITLPAGVASATIPIAIAQTGSSGANPTFQLHLDGAAGIGPAPSFATQSTFVTGNTPISVTVADVNGDGKPDLVVTNYNDSTVSVLLNTTAPGTTPPSFAAQSIFVTGAGPISVTVADVNGDGKPDLIVANTSPNVVSVLLNTTATGAPTPSFAAQSTFATGTSPFSVTFADVNGDGKPDMVVANLNDNTVSVLLNTTVPGATTPSFAAQSTFATGPGPTSVTVADVDGDGKPDLVVANVYDNTVSVLLNTTAPGAPTPSFGVQSIFVTGNVPDTVTVADANGDGKPDLVVANGWDDTVSVLLNTTAPGATTPSFAAQSTFAAGAYPRSVTVADVNADGKPDLVVANQNDNTLSVLLNATVPGATMPSFAAQATFATEYRPQSVTVADVNGDGKPDLVVANYNSNTVSVLLNTTAAPTATPGFAAQQAFVTGAYPKSVTTADVNGDGKLDLIVANNGNDTVSVLLDTTAPGASTSSFAAQQAFATGAYPVSVIPADVNGDGKPDLIVANFGVSFDNSTVSVLLNTTAPGATTPSFATQQTFAAGLGPRSVAAADVNGDGRPDLIVANSNDNTVSVLLNTTAPGDATPSFAALQTLTTGSGPYCVTAADVNGDGTPDLIVANANDNTVSVLLNTTVPGATTSSFAAQQTFATGSYPLSVATADVNGDGKPDLIVVNGTDNTVSLLLNITVPGAPGSSFAAQQTFAAGAGPQSVTAADVNGDGKPDLIVANGTDNTVSMLLNTTVPGAAAPNFAAQQTFAAGAGPQSAAADVNGDGEPDLIAVNGDASVSVLLNTQYQALFAGSPATGTIVHTYYTVTATVAGTNGAITPSTQSVIYGSQASVTTTPSNGYHALIDPTTTCPGGSLSGDAYTTAAITTDCSVVVTFTANPPTALTITVTDNGDYARYDGSLNYTVAVTNTGLYDAATGVALSNTLPAQIDAANTQWICIGAGNGASCTDSGNGDLNTTGIVIPAGRTLYWLVSAPVQADASGDTIDYAVSAIAGDGGATVSATDSDTLVIFRGGFDVANADGAQDIEPQAALVAPQFP